MAQEYLDKTGLTYFWGKIKDKISSTITASAGTVIPYGYCETAAGTAAKTVTVTPAVTELTTGLHVLVKFKYANTKSSPTLKVNSTTAKAIRRYGTTSGGTNAAGSWNAESVVMLMYDGTDWKMVDYNNTTYSTLTQADATAGTATSARVITAKVLHDSIVELLPTKLSDLTDDVGYITTESDPTVPAWAKASTKPSYTAQEVGALPSTTTIPSTTSDLVNDAGFITTESDPTVPAWAKESTKPSYTATEVGALPASTPIPYYTSDLVNDIYFVSDPDYVHTDYNFNSSYKSHLDTFSNITSSDITLIINSIT